MQKILAKYNSIEVILKLTCFCIFLGRGYQHLFWDAPYRSLFWDEQILAPMFSLFGLNWQAYVTSATADSLINTFVLAIGVFYVLAGVMCLFVNDKNKKIKAFIFSAGISLIGLALLQWKEQFYRLGMLIEHSSQYLAPFLLLYFIGKKQKAISAIYLSLRFIMAMTFLGHGLYAIGFYPVPGHFIDMVISITGLSENHSLILLKIAGSFDILFAVSIILAPMTMFSRKLLILATGWGLATAMARIVAHVEPAYLLEGLHRWSYEFVLRTPHFTLVFLLFLIINYFAKELSTENPSPTLNLREQAA